MISALVASSLAMAGGDIAPVEPMVETPVVEAASGWQNEITIYGWYAGIGGETALGEPSDPSVDASDILDKLEMVFMGTYAGRGDKWSFYLDLIYLGLGDSSTRELTIDGVTFDSNIEADIDTWLLNTGVGYNLVNTDSGVLDVIAGVRYMDLEATVETNHPRHPGSEASKDFVDFVVGARGSMNINENWYVPYVLDVGAGDSDLTWQAFAGIGYRYDWGDVKLGYRYISYDFDDSMFLKDLDMSGGVLGVTFKF